VHLDENVEDPVGDSGIDRQGSCSAQRVRGCIKGSPPQEAQPEVEQDLGRPFCCPRLGMQPRGKHESLVIVRRPLDHFCRIRRQTLALGWEQVRDDDLAGQEMPELKVVHRFRLGGHELAGYGRPEVPEHLVRIQLDDLRQQPPVESSSEHGRGPQRRHRLRWQGLHSPGHRVGEAPRHVNLQRTEQRPPAVPDGQRAGSHQSREEVLHQEWQAIAVLDDEAYEGGWC
jgi:hypothetical protein